MLAIEWYYFLLFYFQITGTHAIRHHVLPYTIQFKIYEGRLLLTIKQDREIDLVTSSVPQRRVRKMIKNGLPHS